MKKEYRLKKNEDFQKVIKQKKSFANKVFVIYYKVNDDHLRAGLSVSHKLGKAVVRNRIKRQVRAMVQDIFDKQLNLDVIIIVRYHFLEHTYQENLQQLENLYRKICRRTGK